MIGKLTTIMVVVKDMKRSVQFYRDVLALPLGMESPHWSQFDLGNVTSVFIEMMKLKRMTTTKKSVAPPTSLLRAPT